MRLAVVVSLWVVVGASLGAFADSSGSQFGECAGEGRGPALFADDLCTAMPAGDGPFPPDLVTGHTVFGSWVVVAGAGDGSLSAPFPSVAAPEPQPALPEGLPDLDGPQFAGGQVVQAECVAWLNGWNLDQRPAATYWAPGPTHFPSDDDEPTDVSMQDMSLARYQRSCLPSNNGFWQGPAWLALPTDFGVFAGFFARHDGIGGTVSHGTHAVAVERGDCAPADGFDFLFRAHLDFVDPNNVYHEVQEYTYSCPRSGPHNAVPEAVPHTAAGKTIGALIRERLPTGGYDPHNQNGCDAYAAPPQSADPANLDPGYVDLGHKCNGSVQDLSTERLWITRVHASVFEPTVMQPYNFALQVDTCSGLQVRELMGSSAMGAHNNYARSGSWKETHPAQSYLWRQWEAMGLGPYPFPDVCIDGSSFSFDDTARSVVRHARPALVEETMRGASLDQDPMSWTFGKHRTNCRHNALEWRFNILPNPDAPNDEPCFVEDHRAAAIDVYVYGEDPTGGLFALHANGLTGQNAFVGPGTPSRPTGTPGAD